MAVPGCLFGRRERETAEIGPVAHRRISCGEIMARDSFHSVLQSLASDACCMTCHALLSRVTFAVQGS